jgi:hypothetical protein
LRSRGIILECVERLRWQFRHGNTIVPRMPLPHQPVEVLATVPIMVLFFALQHLLVSGRTTGSVKG